MSRTRVPNRPRKETLRRRYERAQVKPPSRQTVADIKAWIRHLSKSSHKHCQRALTRAKGFLLIHETETMRQKAEKILRREKRKGTIDANTLEDVLKVFASGGQVKGFTLNSTAKSYGHNLLYPVLDAEDVNNPDLLAPGTSLCIYKDTAD